MGVFASRIMKGIKLGTPLSDLEVETSVYINENGNPIEYLIANQGIPENSSLYDVSCNGVWVIRKDIAEIRVWDASASNIYANSDINLYLNSTWLDRYDAKVIENIKTVKIPNYAGGGSASINTGANGLEVRAFLPGRGELGYPNYAGDGAPCSMFSSDASRIAMFNGNAHSYYTRTPQTANSNTVFSVYITGASSSVGVTFSDGIRPFMIFSFDTTVDDNMLIA